MSDPCSELRTQLVEMKELLWNFNVLLKQASAFLPFSDYPTALLDRSIEKGGDNIVTDKMRLQRNIRNFWQRARELSLDLEE